MDVWQDSIHGPIQWFDVTTAESFSAVMRSQPVRRLRHISQLGFASESYPMATHNRLSHSLGTMNVAIQLAAKFTKDQVNETIDIFRKTFEAPKTSQKTDKKRTWLVKHIALAALLQDLGQLPFEQSTSSYFELDGPHRQQVSSWLGCDPNLLTGKQGFTLGCLNYMHEEIKAKDFDFILVAQMIAPDLFPERERSALVQMVLDSPFDADRIDYVLRDGVPTIGSSIQASQVISSIEKYGENKLVINSAAPIAGVILTRNVLYRAVYLDPRKRFHEAALRSLISSIKDMEQSNVYSPKFGEIAISDFLTLNDQSILNWASSIYDAKTQPSTIRRLAGTVVGLEEPEYDTVWLSRTPSCEEAVDISDTGVLAAPSIETKRALDVPFDFFSVDGSDPKATLKSIVPELFSAEVDEQKDAILSYLPKNNSSFIAKRLDEARASGALYNSLSAHLAEQSFGCSADTRNMPGFTGRPIHISWCWDDISYVRRIVRALYRKQQRYRILLTDFDGLGNTTKDNSTRLIEDAAAVLIVASRSYTDRWRQLPNGNLATELLTINRRIERGDDITVIAISIDPWYQLEEAFPWATLGFTDSPPFVGKPLSTCNSRDIEVLIDTVIGSTHDTQNPEIDLNE